MLGFADHYAYMVAMTETAPPRPEMIRVIDLETTGNSFTDGGVVEIGWQDLVYEDQGGPAGWRLSGPPHASLVQPGNPISAATSAIHHIVDEDVAGAPPWIEVAPSILSGQRARRAGTRLVALAAHRAAFEQRWCVPALAGRVRWICTYKCALRLWPEEAGHSNQGLRYSRRPEGLDRALATPAHRAGPDAYVTAHHLRDMLAMADLKQLLAWSDEPALLVKVPFGPARGRRWRDLDEVVLARIAEGEAGGNGDMVFSARMEQQRRGSLTAGGPPGGGRETASAVQMSLDMSGVGAARD